MDTIKIGEFLKALRKAKGYTQEEVANHLMLSPKTISRWENGEVPFDRSERNGYVCPGRDFKGFGT